MRALAVLAALVLAVPAQATPPSAVTADPPRDAVNPARMEVLHVPSGGVAINAVEYVASGPGPHPTLVICHGLPGNEKNLDLAQAVRRAGWNAVTFNYRGSWGSPGEFHFAQNPDDARAVLAYLRDPANAGRLNVDPGRIAIAGHSMGGWVAALVAGSDRQLIGVATISMGDVGKLGTTPHDRLVALVADNAETLATTPDAMAAELTTHGRDYSVLVTAPGVARLPYLALTSDDGLASDTDALVDAVRARGGTAIVSHHVATDHSWSDRRIALATAIIDWLATLP